MGQGETYLHIVFGPWWRTLSHEERERYLEANDAPDDWRLRLVQIPFDPRRRVNDAG
jgi:hypothetical protein